MSDGIKKSYELNKLNAPLLGLDEIKIFEIGTVFSKNGEEIHVSFANKKEVKEMSLDELVASLDQENLAALPSLRGRRLGQNFPDPISPSQSISDADSEKVLPASAINYFKIWS